MSAETPAPAAQPRVPGPVIFAAILNFVSALTLGFIALLSLAGIVFGNVMGLHDLVAREMAQYASSPNFSYGVMFLLGVLFAFTFSGALFLFLLGVWLLKGKRLAWYAQATISVIFLLAFPVGTLFNGFILFFFFRQPIRDFFKV